ncbi:hypothetical protein N7493_006576 [Penicillium malachiteum]|uniref:Xaa-Pro dipeptidyl-peptidase C-terminal domain-containing protein n=1 Tax=Penicillium malachiteum TaxID=1324776 RepID=A0AAD6MVQ2_9EURO|nr:hypothetical protein N7493_006576 [Penicillium malachiteum]
MPPPVQAAYKRVAQPQEGENGYQACQTGKSEILPKGWNGFKAKPFESDIQIDHDVEIVVRNGVRLYADVYRPANTTEKVPAVLSWSFYGKKYSALDMLPMTTWHCCVKPSELSGLEKFEGLDPQAWCPQGYAIAIVRGPESSGLEDFEEMYRRSPISSPFWEDKRVDISRVKCPVFIRGSDVSSIRGYLEVSHADKWIQRGSKQEWYELYSVPESTEELNLFFDRYLKGKDNGWEKTPKVRWSALQFGSREAIDNIVLDNFPATTTEYRELFFGENNQLHDIPASKSTTARLIGLPKAVVYISCEDRDDFTVFVILRKKDKNGKDLMHLNFPIDATPVKSIEEIPEKDQASLNLHLGSVGILRASHREIDGSKSIHSQFPFHPHKKEERIPKGTIVKLEIGIWAMGVEFDEGESISVRVGGQYPSIAEYKTWSKPRPEHGLNRGRHTVHFGKDYPSSVILPFI